MALNDFFIYKGEKFTTGDKVTCTIQEKIINDAKIYILSKEEESDYIIQRREKYIATAFICQNLLFGTYIENKFGYNDSWIFEFSIIDNDQYLSEYVRNLKKINQNCFNNIIKSAFPIIQRF
jgi:hypothetical protein